MRTIGNNPVLLEVLTVFLQPLADAYGEPTKTENVEGFLYEYANLLKGYTRSELASAKERVLRSHKGPHRWPRIPECVAACEEARAAIRTRMGAEQNQQRVAALSAMRKKYTQQELLEAQICVDEWASGRAKLTAPAGSPPEKHIELRLLSKRLRALAVQLRAKRGNVAC